MKCYIVGCRNNDKKKGSAGSKLSFHMFPMDSELRQKWIKVTGIVPTETTRICSEHFEMNCFFRTSYRTYLVPNAIPSLNLRCEVRLGKENADARYNTVDIINSVTNFDGDEMEVFEIDNNILYQNIGTQNIDESSFSSSDSIKIEAIGIDHIEAMPTENISRLSPRKPVLKRKYLKTKKRWLSPRKKFKTLQQNKRQINNLESILTELTKQNLNVDEITDFVACLSSTYKEILQNQLRQKICQVTAKCCPKELKTFALNLNFFSPKAYEYVRETFDSSLPHPRTFSSWYQNINYDPGFTSEALYSISQAVNEASKNCQKLVCNIVFNEIHISKQIEWDHLNLKWLGNVNFGDGGSDEGTAATQILVFMVVCLNASWKIPVGFFPIASIDGEQKKNLLLHCIWNLLVTGIEILGVTFDGCRTNLSMSNLLGCNLSSIKDEYYFKIDNCDDKFIIYLDPVHMIKLIRDHLADKRIFLVGSEKIEWKYLVLLQNLQEEQGPHLENKLKKSYVYFQKQKIKVKFAVQAFSKSVADAIDYCREVLKIKQFENSHATSNFIRNINDIFDILNSKKMTDIGLKKPLNKDNFNEIEQLCNTNIEYLQSIKLQNGCLLINSQIKSGFIGMIACLQNMKIIYNRLISTNILPFVPTYKLNQDHVELFFPSIRTRMGYNINPTVKQFIATYKQLLVRCQIRKGGIGNCLPLEEISILRTNPKTTKEIKNQINFTSDRHRLFDECATEVENVNKVLDEHNYMFNPRNLNEYTKIIVEYISGYLVFKLYSQLNCKDCLSLLGGEVSLSSLINYKSKGYLKHPSSSVIKICEIVEKEFRLKKNEFNNDIRLLPENVHNEIFVSCMKKTLCNRNIFSENVGHPVDHYSLLIRLIVKMYLNLRYYYIVNCVDDKVSIRNHLIKIILFQGM